MALGVFLVVFHKYETKHLRKLERWYLGGITGLVLIPAVAFLFVHTGERGPMYGSQTVVPHTLLPLLSNQS
jgi:hypothetical protein